MFKKIFENRFTTTIFLMVVGFIIGGILQTLHVVAIAWFFLPLLILIVSLLLALGSKGKAYRYIAWVIAIVLAYVFLTPGLFRHYPLIVLAVQNRDAQNERDIARETNVPFAKSYKELDLYDAKIDTRTADTLHNKLFDEDGNPKDSVAYKEGLNKFKSEATQYRSRKNDRIQVDTLINPIPKVQQTESQQQNSHLKAQNPPIDTVKFDGKKRKPSNIYLNPGDRCLILATASCSIELPDGTLYALDINEEYKYTASCYGFVTIFNGAKGGKAILRSL